LPNEKGPQTSCLGALGLDPREGCVALSCGQKISLGLSPLAEDSGRRRPRCNRPPEILTALPGAVTLNTRRPWSLTASHRGSRTDSRGFAASQECEERDLNHVILASTLRILQGAVAQEGKKRRRLFPQGTKGGVGSVPSTETPSTRADRMGDGHPGVSARPTPARLFPMMDSGSAGVSTPRA
jgi:hypothetical protein